MFYVINRFSKYPFWKNSVFVVSLKDELRSVMQKMGQSPTEEELDAMFNAADQDHDGNIDFKGTKARHEIDVVDISL